MREVQHLDSCLNKLVAASMEGRLVAREEVLDIAATNFTDEIIKTEVMPPLRTPNGRGSDHNFVHYTASTY